MNTNGRDDAALDSYDDEDLKAVEADDHDDDASSRGDRSPTDFDKVLGQAIRRLRNRRKVALAPLAAQLTPLTPAEPWYVKRIQRLELGERRIDAVDIDVILRGLGVTWLEFVREAGLARIPDTTRDMIAVDSTLDSRARKALLRFYAQQQDETRANED